MSQDHMKVDRGALAADLRNLGVSPGDVLLVHSSLSSLGWVEGGADAVVDAIIGAVGPDGTVIFPTLTGQAYYSPENPPEFDVRRTPCWTGTIPETARQRPDAVRSLHPTHSVAAIGKLAGWITSGHEFSRTPCGFGSPYDKLADIGGKILLIGVTQEVNTSFHHAEEISGVPYVIQDQPVDCVVKGRDGRDLPLQGMFIHLYGPGRDYMALEPEMIDMGIVRVGPLGASESRLIDASTQRRFLVRRLLEDPWAVVTPVERGA